MYSSHVNGCNYDFWTGDRRKIRQCRANFTSSATCVLSAAAQQEKQASLDPVICMLAMRASPDFELKALMTEVATGKATLDRLGVFEWQIDDLTKILNDKKYEDGDEAEAAA
jgi:hypothetical protein